MRTQDLSGQRFGRLVALSVTHTPVSIKGRIEPRRSWVCRCDCGATVTVWTGKLTSGHTQSCGCLQRERTSEAAKISSRKHGCHGWPEYQVWRGMLNRCHLPTDCNYPRYGARGIQVCDRWRFGEDGKHPFDCFIQDMGRRPSAELSIDRYPDNRGNYEPGNCRWATRSQQERNKPRRQQAEAATA